MRQQEDFLIGSLIGLIAADLERRVLDGNHAAGFTDIRAAHAEVFRKLPPGGCRVTELAERMYSSKQAVGYLVNYLEGRGYLERVPDPTDRRAQLVRRTARGWSVNASARQIVRQIQEEWGRQLGEERTAETLESLRALVRLLGIPYAGSVSEVSTRQNP